MNSRPASGGSPTNKNDRITLQVGERRFTTLRETLIGDSDYFASRLSGRWNDQDEDGSYFVDSDPTLFEHILRYLRSGNPPIFFDSATLTFDHAKYMSLLGEARYFGIHELIDWIGNKKYMDTVSIRKSVVVLEDTKEMTLASYLNQPGLSDNRVEMSTSWHTKSVYVCPRRIPVHYGDRLRCGRACETTRENNGGKVEYEDESILRAVITITTITWDGLKS